MKKCITCHKEKSSDDFYRNKNYKDGRQSKCKVCYNAAYSVTLTPEQRKASYVDRNRKYPRAILKKGLRMLEEGFSYRVIEAELGIPPSGMKNYYKKGNRAGTI